MSKIKDPVKPDCCHHIFCKLCIQLYSQSFTFCPTCKKSFLKFSDVYDFKKERKENFDRFFNDLSGDRLYRLSLKKIPDDIYIVCKKDEKNDYLILCDKCGVNYVHYYCDPSPQIGIGFYICPICRIRCYKQIKTK